MLPFVPFQPRRRAASTAVADVPALLAQLAAGDSAALDELYRRESGPVYRYALALSGNAASAADATQEAFIALATRPQGYDAGRGSLGAYLAGVARHHLQALWRSQRLEDSLEPGPDEPGGAPGERAGLPLAGTAPSPETLLVRVQDSAELWAALRSLPAPMREALVLVDLQERPYAEAAHIAGCEINTLRTRLHRARLKLAALLGADGRSPP
ncbi:RNA polymerase sigma factor [Rubrivivax rivuli]|uniref:Sigma-70 family RNA polymerase sigma factor n=1 Tax=Rubrivivax rivuli TaxID=1862385 RepID=A0A437RSJ1_9BURK|nr:sigma-70 family RNA polymerase sigma factor [Rubrivivax rivuli]RVU49723.1 sigma-70 family RNA polymerase sigma factor [Rubrivivax rivuli]